MNSLHLLYLESILGIKIGEFAAGVAEFTGVLTQEVIERVVASSGTLFWQEPQAEVSTMAYLYVPTESGQRIDFGIDYNFNTIYCEA